MNKVFYGLLVCFLFTITSIRAQSDAYFTAYPTLSPDGGTVVFSFEGDLWRVASAGGDASRITAMPGD
ncbi:MAG: hypothetical protein EOP49_53495, partial [Sphingobacteriales bacterium]